MAIEKLLSLLERDELDWDNLRHREIYLRTWVKAPDALPKYEPQRGEEPGDR